MPRTRVAESQYEATESEVVHTPTGARFTWYPGATQDHYNRFDVGQLGSVLPNGEDYDPGEVKAGAIAAHKRAMQKA
jgi:hypothetical protein